jgi:uncharacterized membrane protein YeaQ/YmgE (transglycosylase-associated protein family)
MKDYSKYSHTFAGIFWFDVPLGLILIFIFHNVVKNKLIEYLPFSFNVRLSLFARFDWNKYFRNNIMVVLISLIVGITSHLFWDSFTHTGGYFAKAIPILTEQMNILNHQISGARIFQYVSSIIGALILLLAVLKLPEGSNTKQDNILNFWLLVSLVMIFVLNIRLYLDRLLNHHDHEDVIVTMISGALTGIIVLSFLLKKSNKPRVHKTSRKISNS